MDTFKVTYFDVAGSRGEELRLALTIAGAPFEDVRIKRPDYPALKTNHPFPSLPVLEINNQHKIAQTNAALRYIGLMFDLYPTDPLAAAKTDVVMDAVEDLRHKVSPTLSMRDPVEKSDVRQRIAKEYIPHWGRGIEEQFSTGPFLSGDKPGVADIKLFVLDRWIGSGMIDDIPAAVFDPFKSLKRAVSAVSRLPVLKGRYN
ncbi:glutathione S-transferase family protein [Tateyamaria pelophila]|uniref:glutathione S-transferase family protein n=1 Tax=Tateyamaria pelophila TaxID=328415 RepID=UPI001CC0C027|nr:glutathione S-transferase family protein [Tateyamaria pelophila]